MDGSGATLHGGQSRIGRSGSSPFELGLEALEQRVMLSGSDPAPSVFAQFRDRLPPMGPVAPIEFTISEADFSLSGGRIDWHEGQASMLGMILSPPGGGRQGGVGKGDSRLD